MGQATINLFIKVQLSGMALIVVWFLNFKNKTQ